MKQWARVTAVVGLSALVLAACGEAPEDETAAPAASGDAGASAPAAEEVDFTGCMVTDAGGVDDRSFNEAADRGLSQAVEELGIEKTVVESSSETDYTPNVEQLVQQDCDLIVGVGFLLAGAVGEAAAANPEETFALIDSTLEEPADNVKPLLFNTAEAAFLGGYLAAGMTETGTVATFGGIPIPPVTIFMDGFVDGVAYYNEQKGTDVQVLGWDKDAQDGTFTGDFENQAQGQTVTENFIGQGADIILPVAGPVGLGAAAAAEAAGDVDLIWVDSDGYESASQYGPLFISSVLKNIDAAVFDATQETLEDSFSSEPYVGTLENGGVGLAPYHDFEDEVPQELKDEITALQDQIISGEVAVESPASPSVG
ncbi:BMP family lipoprotein [Aquipuribacter nitratireducens]|uniref:BMP family protein n=1 Tax=Aquipuribacter nitratireducens TaxID=650104 RepID=A0ABW0GK59_9MICO